MKAVVQRVNKAKVLVNEIVNGEIEKGILIFLGIGKDDTIDDAKYLWDKISKLRIFSDKDDKMNLSVKDLNGEVMVVSQFTLYGDCKKGTRPSFDKAMNPKDANLLYEYFVSCVKDSGLKYGTGQFQAYMKVEIENDGPVTLIIESKK